MTSQIITNKISQNTIFITWKIDNCRASLVQSPPFTITSDGSLISFMLSIFTDENLTVNIEQTTGKVGRAVVWLAVKDDIAMNAMKAYFTEKWKTTYSFCNIARLPKLDYQLRNYPTTYLRIDCKITWFGFVEDVTIPKFPLPPLSIANVPFNNTVFPDFTIIVRGQELLAHKAILARNSSVLLAMFESPMKQSKENKIVIEDIEYSTMELLLRIMYTGESEALNDVDTALAVLEAAEKYQMSMIKSLCECKLQLRIQRDNVLMLLEEADKYNAQQLCETCVVYVLAVRDDKITCAFRKITEKPNISIAFINAVTDQLSLIPIGK